MTESLDIDSPMRGVAMLRLYSGDLREPVIEVVEMEGASPRGAAERCDISVSSAVKWPQRRRESRSAAPRPRRGAVSPLFESIGDAAQTGVPFVRGGKSWA
jgi:hypothetical protein